ncbi:hypothetical protein [Natrinema ejinorense]|uniref:hypothetical protein n=1 Tax=Natrinema ejinorense TaxID=373386 RepID=UPI00147635C1|nr:hypothetical protein [Natrinema ejinorense]
MLGFVPATIALVTGNPLTMLVSVVSVVLFSTDVGSLITAWRDLDSIAVPDPAY